MKLIEAQQLIKGDTVRIVAHASNAFSGLPAHDKILTVKHWENCYAGEVAVMVAEYPSLISCRYLEKA